MTALALQKGTPWPIRCMQLAMAVVVTWTFVVAPALAQGFQTRAKQAILIDADTGAVLFERNADERMHPASMSKLMTLVMAFKALRSGRLKMEDEIVMSVNAWRNGGAPSGTSAMMVPVGEKVTVSELLQGIIVQSGNDASIAIAETLAGTEEAFAELMTKHAREIGLNPRPSRIQRAFITRST